MDKVKAKGGAMFAVAQQLGNRDGLELNAAGKKKKRYPQPPMSPL